TTSRSYPTRRSSDLLQLAAGAKFGLALGSYRDVAVAAEGTLGHVAIADAQIAHQRVDGAGIGDRFLGAAHVRLGDDLQQRRAGRSEEHTSELQSREN